MRSLGRSFGAGKANRASAEINAAHVAQKNFARNRQAIGQDDAGRKGPDAARDRTNDHKAGIERERSRRDDEGGAAASLLAAECWIKIGPNQVAGFWQVLVRTHSSTCSRPRSGPQSYASL